MPCETVDCKGSNFDTDFAHSEGNVVCAYSPDGKYLYTAGSCDLIIRVFDTEDAEASLIEYFHEGVTSLDCSFDALVAGSEDGKVASFSHDPTHLLQQLITRCPPGSKIRHVKFGFNGRKIAVASDELVVKVIDTRDITKIHQLTGHNRGVRAVSWNSDASLLVTSGFDGMLKIWDTASDKNEPSCIKTIDSLVATGDPDTVYAAQATWHPSGKYFVVGTKSHEVAIISRGSWVRTGTFSTDGHNADISALAFSPNGNYLASAAHDKEILVWETLTQEPLYRLNLTDGFATCLAWATGPGANTLAYGERSGTITRWSDVISDSSRPHPSDGPIVQARAPIKHTRQDSRAESVQPRQRARSIDISKSDGLDEDDGWIDDDMNGAYADPDDIGETGFGREKSIAKPLPVASTIGTSLYTSTSLAQPAFQPGATPFKDKRRYLAFNHVGLIHTVDRDQHNLVTVEFHDRSMHRGYHFDDNYRFEMASIGERGIAYACAARGDMPSQINYRPYETWSAQADWQFKLPAGETVVAIGVGGLPIADVDAELAPCLGSGTILVATDAGYLRFFSGSGLQSHLIDLGQEIVALSVGKEWAFVVHRTSGVLTDGRQNLQYSVYDCDTFEVLQHGDIPLMKKLTLTWIGFTQDQIPAIYKSNGVLSLLSRARRPGQARWTAVLDTNTLERREGKQEAYWPVTIARSYMNCIILKGEEKHPFFPTPLLQEIALKLPTLISDDQQGVLEENYLRDSLITGHVKDGFSPEDRAGFAAMNASALEIDKHLLKLMQMACKADRLEQALEAARHLNQPQSLDAASKLAGFFRQAGLEERIQLIKEAKTGQAVVDRIRKESKWGHLVDNRTVVDSTLEASEYNSTVARKAQAVDDFAKPIQHGSQRRSLGDSTALAAKVTKALFTRPEDSGLGSSEASSETEQLDVVEDEEFQDSIDRAVAHQRQPSMEQPAPKKAKSLNPFAAKAPRNAVGQANSNPFAAKRTNTGGPQTGTDVKRSDSFFQRVEGTENAKSKPAAKQAGLFGKEAKDGEPAAKKQRKRKAPAEELDEKKRKKSKAQPGLKSFIQKPAEPASETEETQLVDSMVVDEHKTSDATGQQVERPLESMFDEPGPMPVSVEA